MVAFTNRKRRRLGPADDAYHAGKLRGQPMQKDLLPSPNFSAAVTMALMPLMSMKIRLVTSTSARQSNLDRVDASNGTLIQLGEPGLQGPGSSTIWG